jgi:hypothetical protein
MRITKAYLNGEVQRFSEFWRFPMGVDWSGAPVRPRLYLADEKGRPVRDLGPRGTTAEVFRYFEAFAAGFDQRERHEKGMKR